jgi:hypothetical protein
MILIDKQAINRHKVLTKLLKDVKPCDGKETWANGIKGIEDRIYGTRTVTLSISDDWKSAESVSTNTFKNYYTVSINHFIIEGNAVRFNFGNIDPRGGVFYTDYESAVKHLEEHRVWFAENYPDRIYKGCGAHGCRFCDKFAEIGKVPDSL